MLSNEICTTYQSILIEELQPAMGCTEPIAIAYASALMRDALGDIPTDIEISLSGNIIKNVKSVIVFGRMEIVDDKKVIADIVDKLSRKFTGDNEYIKNEIEQHLHHTLLLKLVPEHICGKLVNES